jgi:hypothetical protein
MSCAVLNIPQPPTSFSICNKNIGSAVTEVSQSTLMQAAGEAVAENEDDDPSHLTACVDGTRSRFDDNKMYLNKIHLVCGLR